MADGRIVTLDYTPTVGAFIETAATGRMPDGRQVDEVAVVGPRGEGKSFGCLAVPLRHAQLHEQAGFPLPVTWFWFRDTFPNHERNLLQDIKRIEWQGLWRESDGGRQVVAEMRGSTVINAFLFGLEDTQAIERLRGGCIGVYGEEPAPAVGVGLGSGWSEASWALALSSQARSANTHYSPAIIASNYPDKHHWFWRRFADPGQAQCGLFRIASGDRTSEQYRQRLGRTLASQPAMYKRLFVGEPAPPQLGDPVIVGYRQATHYTTRPLRIGAGPLYLAWDFWHHPAVAIATVSPLGQLLIHYARHIDRADIGTLVDEHVRPWLAAQELLDRPRIYTGDPTGDDGDQSDKTKSAVKRLRSLLPGVWSPSTNAITALQNSVGEALKRTLSTGDPCVQLGPEASELDSAWSGGWHLNETGHPVQSGERGQYAHVGMAGAYLVHLVFGGAHGDVSDLSAWVNQTAYTQPWNGQTDGHAISPAAGVLAGRGSGRATINEAAWRRQYD